MITELARGEMSTVILPVQAVVLGIALLGFLGGVPLITSALIMRDSRDHDTSDRARLTFVIGVSVFALALIMTIAIAMIYGDQGGFG